MFFKPHRFRSFVLTAYEPFDRSGYTEDYTVAILRGFTRQVSQDILSLYTEYLVVNDNKENDVVGTIKSKLVDDAIFVKYKLPFEVELLKERFQKRPKLNGM